MPTIRDDSAGSYGAWNNDDLSWLDYLTAKASDGGNALANLGRNLAQGFSPIGTSEQGNMALQVPPIVSGIAQSYSNLAGSPSHPGNAYDLTGVPELDAPIQQDMMNALLPFYGGQAVGGLSRAIRGAPLAKAVSDTGKPSILGSAMAGAGENRSFGSSADLAGSTRGAVNQTPGARFSTQLPDGVRVERSPYGMNYDVFNGDAHIGAAAVRDLPENVQVSNVSINPDWQRQGIGSALHGIVERDFGKQAIPDTMLSDPSYAFWKKYDPESVKGFSKNRTGYYSPAENIPDWLRF